MKRRLLAGSPALVLACLLAAPLSAQVRPGTGGFAQRSTPADEDLYFHVLQRTSFGPTEGSLARIRAMGVDAYLWEQLHPATIDDSALEARLASELPAPTDLQFQWAEVTYDYLVRAASSQRQLEAVMTQFWENHFDTSIEHGNNDDQQHAWAMMEHYENEAFRAGAFGRLRDLLEVSAKSQAMVWFLDNYQNTVRSNNENYAREIMELHTLGVDCGYDQFDVEQVTRIFTGWSGAYFARVPPNPCDPGEVPPACDPNHYTEPNGFFFNNAAHDNLPKPNPVLVNPRADVLGTTFAAGGGMQEGLRVMDILSRHPCTARFLSQKLLQQFVSDSPSPELVDRIAARYLETDGDIRQVLWAIFQTPEFRDPRNFGGKVKTPLEQALSALRATEGLMRPRTGGWGGYAWPWMWYFVYDQGQAMFRMPIPTGYPETALPWVSANGFLNRWKYADTIMFLTPGRSYEVETDPIVVMQRLRLTTADGVIDHWSRVLFGRTVDAPRRTILRALLVSPTSGNYEPADAGQSSRLREMISNMLGFPEFNKQ